MKKGMAILLIMAMLLSVAACDGEGETDSKEPEEKKFSLGEVNGQIYENEFLGMGCELSDDWMYYAQPDMRHMDDGDEICAMHATVKDRKVTLRIDFQKTDAEKLKAFDAAGYCGQYLMNRVLNESDSRHFNAAYSNISVEIGSKTVDGRLLTMFNRTYKWCEAVFAIKCNGYIARISVHAYDQEEVENIMDCFYLLSHRPD